MRSEANRLGPVALRRSTSLVLIAALATPSLASAQCGEPESQSFGDTYRQTLGGALIGAPIGAAGGVLLGLLLPLVFCNAGVGPGGCEAAWYGTAAVGLGGLLFGSALGSTLALDPPSDAWGAAAGMGVLAGGLLFAGGMGLREATDEPAFLPISVGLWALSAMFVTPLAMAAFADSRPCAAASAPLVFRF